MPRYKKCFVPTCTNSERYTPDKVLVRVKDSMAEDWCQRLKLNFDSNHRYHCCEDHLNLSEDLENYHYWKLMKGHPILKSTATLKINTPDTAEVQPTCSSTPTSSELQYTEPTELQKLLSFKNQPLQQKKRKVFNAVSKPINTVDIGVQCKVKTVEKSTNYIARSLLPSKPTGVSPIPETWTSSPSITEKPSSFGWTSETESLEYNIKQETKLRENFLGLINKNPRRYLGLPMQFKWVLKYVCEKSNKKLNELDLIVTLFKIRQNDSMVRISEQFQISQSALTSIFMKGVESLANFFQNLIYLPSLIDIKKNLPTVFKVRYSNIQCILDCFEIEIEKPSVPLRQAQSWSQYKSCNTLKYLIGCTPNGFICFISKGFGGRISDKAILERSNLINILPFNAVVMADRGFKEVESHLMTKGIKLLRPPSVYSGTKPTKDQVIQTKIIASLRVHVERVIRRLREYKLLKPHSVVKYSHVGYMDQIVIIGCGLANLQQEIIKSV